ncbi:MAG: trypsin-like serine protease [Verrucomicrobiota bacterium]|nr:trypsin-like serine protease [Verrucomicrobiota bacterium]
MCRQLSCFMMFGVLFGACVDVRAIAVEDLPTSQASPTNETFFGSAFNWDHVYNYKGASASAVDHYWVLTAAHVADDGGTGSLVIDGETYLQQEVVLHSQAADPDGNLTADIALVRYDKPLPGYYLLADSVPVGSEVMICGFGRSGTVVSTFSDAYFTEDGTTHTDKRWGTNVIDSEETSSSTVPIVATTKGFDTTISKDRVNAAKTDYEAGCNIYDSGGGMFYDDNGTWKHVGHMVGRYSVAANEHTGNFAAATKYYVNWIKSVIVDYDTDMDGLPDWWETLYGGDAISMDAAADLDVDGFSNYGEWIADTDPTNSVSRFQILEWLAPTNVTFSSSADRWYQIESRTDLADTNETWLTDVDWFAGSASQTETNVASGTSNGFYRIRAKLR